jgi:hypothetical protein
MSQKPQPPAPWEPAAFTARDGYAIQALARGEADAEQQLRAFRWITEQASNWDELSFRPGPDGPYSTAFAEGRRFVGLQIFKLKNLKAEILEKIDGPRK